jgi:Tfp pilus assembly protein PilO
MSFNLQSARGKLLLYSVVVIAGGVLVGRAMIVKPKKTELDIINGERNEDRQKADAVRRIGDLERKLLSFKSSFSETREDAWLIERLNQVAGDAGLTFTSVAPMAREKTESYLRIPVRIELACSFHELGDFVSRLENHDAFIKVERLTVAGPPAADPGGVLRVSMTVGALFPMKEPA